MKIVDSAYGRELLRGNDSHELSCLVSSLKGVAFNSRTAEGPTFIGIGGYAGMGKSTLATSLSTSLLDASVLPLDSFMLGRIERRRLGLSGDDPRVIDFDAARTVVTKLRSGEAVSLFNFNHESGEHDLPITVRPTRFIVLEGTPATYPQMAGMVDLGIFLDADVETRKALVTQAEKARQGYTDEEIEARWRQYYLPENARLVEPTKSSAHVIVCVSVNREYSTDAITACVC